MRTYTFYLHDGPDSIPAFEIEMFDHPDTALDHGRKLLSDRHRYDRVVITEDVVEIARLDRSAAAGRQDLRVPAKPRRASESSVPT